MSKFQFIFLILLLPFGKNAIAQNAASLSIPLESIKSIKLVLKDEFSGSEIENYALAKELYKGFVTDMNAMKPAPKLRMMVSCYKYVIEYSDGRKIVIITNGKGVADTPVGNFMAAENLIYKYWPITKETFCKPKNASNSGGGFGF